MSGQSGAAAAEGPGAAGAVLLNERRRQGLSLGDISRQLKLSVRQVEALERDDYAAYKGPVFIHGFIRNYAKLLGLDPEPLIRATDAMLNPPAVPSAVPDGTERLQPVPSPEWKQRLWPVIAIAVLVAIVLSVYLGARRGPEAPRSEPTIAADDKPAPAPKIAPETKTGAGTKARNEPKPESESAAKLAAKSAARPESRTPKPENVERQAPISSGATAAESAGRVTVRMIFEQESWVEIKDRLGNTIFGQLNPAGSRRSVSGEPPLSVVVGNAAGVRLFQGDKSIDLVPHTRVDVARITLE